MDDWQKTIGTREELLEALHRERERREAAERERDKMTDERNEAWDTLAAVREYALDTEDDYVLALLDGEGKKWNRP